MNPSQVAALSSYGSAPSTDVVVKQFDNYGMFLDKSQNLTKSAILVLNGTHRFREREGTYFNHVQPWQHHSNTPQDGVNVYSFAIQPEQHAPSGTCNFSRIDNTQLNVTFEDGVNTTNAGNLYVYAFNYNVLRITAGMGGLAYAS